MNSIFLANLARSGQGKLTQHRNVEYLKEMLLDEYGRLQAIPATELRSIPHLDLVYFCNVYGFYSIPSTEFMQLLGNCITHHDKAVEIGAGNGIYGRNLGLKMTDNYQQAIKNRRKFNNCISVYEKAGLGLVPYGDDVVEMDAQEAVRIHKPKTVLGAWVTQKYNSWIPHKEGNQYGVPYKWIYERSHVKQIILVGNTAVHHNVDILDKPHEEIKCKDILFSRAFEQGNDRLYIWNK